MVGSLLTLLYSILGFKLNSIFVPEKDSCFIPQICRVCQSANGDSRIVGLEVVSFKSSSEKEETGTLPLKQVMPSRSVNTSTKSTVKMIESFRACYLDGGC